MKRQASKDNMKDDKNMGNLLGSVTLFTSSKETLQKILELSRCNELHNDLKSQL